MKQIVERSHTELRWRRRVLGGLLWVSCSPAFFLLPCLLLASPGFFLWRSVLSSTGPAWFLVRLSWFSNVPIFAFLILAKSWFSNVPNCAFLIFVKSERKMLVACQNNLVWVCCHVAGLSRGGAPFVVAVVGGSVAGCRVCWWCWVVAVAFGSCILLLEGLCPRTF